jgi:fructuronate reductase
VTHRLGAADRTRPAAPARIVHLGLGAFHRAHQARYTDRAADAADWGITAFSATRRDLAETLAAQDGLFTLVERGDDADRFGVVESLVEARPGDDADRLDALLADPAVGVVTLTITEAGYRVDPSAADGTPLGRLARALDGRRRSSGAPIAIVSCDNVPDNAQVVRRALAELTDGDHDLAAWMDAAVSVVGTSVDRITPQAEPDLATVVADATGIDDRAPVVTEPYADWILSGAFPAGRPAWETAGARFVDDLRPWQTRKLWMLNGAHTLLAAAGPLRGHRTVAEAIGDPELATAVDALWDEDLRHLPDVDGAAYRAALLARFRNPRIEHRLDQIARDAELKVGLRLVPVARADREAGGDAAASAVAIGAWAAAEGVDAATALARLDPVLAADAIVVRAVGEAARRWRGGRA